MKNVAIVCEDIFGLEVYSIVNEINVYNQRLNMQDERFEVRGFICNNAGIFGRYNIDVPVLGGIDDWIPRKGIGCIMGIKEPKAKEEAAVKLKGRGAEFLTVITPWTLMPYKKTIGEGCVISNYSFKDGAAFGNFITMINVMSGASIVGDYTTIDALSNITNAKIGSRVFIGAHAFLMEHVEVGDESVIFPGSMVYTSVKAGSKLAGIPANKVKYCRINERRFYHE